MLYKKTVSSFLRLAFAALIILSVLLMPCCIREDNTTDKPIIAVTIVPEHTFVKEVCGDLVEIITLIAPGYSPESYEPAPNEIERFSKADLYFTIGLAAEEISIIPNITEDIKVIALQNEVSSVYADRMFTENSRDPHIWLSPKRVKIMIKAIAREVSALDPSNADIYNKNADEYIKQLNSLDEYIKNIIGQMENKSFIAFHPAFGYLAEDYGMTMYALQKEGKEAAPRHLQEMVDLAKKEGIKAIFYQEEIDSRQAKAFADEIGGRTVKLAPLSADYIDNLMLMADTLAKELK
ncbi:MAG TPA: zinc ABC transporter substrate-binding protein [Oscillospiraceae bacterium]|nr:zinc ABC transporter substrate-binding protein [Oscillospiraceae bacterium]